MMTATRRSWGSCADRRSFSAFEMIARMDLKISWATPCSSSVSMTFGISANFCVK
jgi:hypothetical protein